MSPDTSLLYMLQLPSARSQSFKGGHDTDDDVDDEGDDDDDEDDTLEVSLAVDTREQLVANRLHLLPDQLTVKCNLEMRVDIALLQRLSAAFQSNLDLLRGWEEEVKEDQRRWQAVVERLSGLEDLFEATHFDWLKLPFK